MAEPALALTVPIEPLTELARRVDMQAHNAAESDASRSPATVVPPIDSCPAASPKPPADESGDLEFCRLDAKSVGLTRLANAIVCSVIAVVLLVVGSIVLWFVAVPFNLLVLPVWIVLGAVGAVSVVWCPRWEHAGWSYRVGEKVVELRFGVVRHVAVSIPLSRLQHIDLHRGPLERRWGLTSLEIHTAGTRDASHRIPGLDAAVASTLRDQLIDAANRGSHAPAED